MKRDQNPPKKFKLSRDLVHFLRKYRWMDASVIQSDSSLLLAEQME